MAHDVQAGLTPAGGRKFGLTMGGALVVFALLAWWRDKHRAMLVFSIAAALFLLGAVVAPRLLAALEPVWMAGARAISKVTTPIIMGVLFFVIITPIGAIMRLFGRNPLTRAHTPASSWITRPAPARRSDLRRQF
jgi:uncharacterized membrane protein (DUF485 family)